MGRLSWWRWQHSWGLLLEVGAILRAWQLGAASLWYDEVNTGWMALQPVGRMLLATGGDVHPPLYYALMWVWLRIGGTVNPWSFRIPSLILSVLAMVAARRLMERLQLTPRAILIATGLLALLPFQVYYGQEARMYALLELLVILAYTAALERRWVWLAVWNAALIWTHNYGAFYAVSSSLLGLAVILRDLKEMGILGWNWWLRHDLARLIGFNLLALATYIPWMGMLAGQMTAVKAGWWQTATDLGAVLASLDMLFWQNALPKYLELLGAMVSFALLGIAVYQVVASRFERKAVVLLGLALLVPAMALGIELVYRPVWLWRSLIGSAVVLYMLIGWAVDRLERVERHLVVASLAPLLAVGLLWYYPLMANVKGNRYDVVQQIADEWQPGDVILHINASTYSGFYFTFPIAGAPQYLSPVLPGTLGALSPQTLSALQVPIATLDDITWRRAWIVWTAGPTITGLEDQYVARLLATYPHQTVYLLPYSPLETGGVWLLSHGSANGSQ